MKGCGYVLFSVLCVAIELDDEGADEGGSGGEKMKLNNFFPPSWRDGIRVRGGGKFVLSRLYVVSYISFSPFSLFLCLRLLPTTFL